MIKIVAWKYRSTQIRDTLVPKCQCRKPLKHKINKNVPKLGLPFRGPHNKDYDILGSILGSPILGNYQMPFGLLDS